MLLSDILSKVRLRIKEKDVQYFSDDDLIDLVNGQMEYFYSLLRGHESKFILEGMAVSLIAGPNDFTFEHEGIAWGQVFTDTQVIPKYEINKPDAFSYEETSTGIKIYNAQEGTAYINYWKPLELYTSADLNSITHWPVWNAALYRAVVVEAQEIREHDNHRTAIFAEEALQEALSRTIQRYGTIERRMRFGLDV